MDGSRDRHPERMVESWARRYARRPASPAALRSGPIRTQFAAAAPVAAPDVLIDVPAAGPPPPELAAPTADAGPGAARPRQKIGLRLGRPGAALPVSLGALGLVAILSAGVLLRSQVEAESAPVLALAASAGPVEDAALLPAAASATVHLRVSAAIEPAQRQRIEAALAEAGYRTIILHQMPFSISTSRVGYFHEQDLVSAEALLAALSGTLDGLELRDYRSLVETAEPGRLDLWIRS